MLFSDLKHLSLVFCSYGAAVLCSSSAPTVYANALARSLHPLRLFVNHHLPCTQADVNYCLKHLLAKWGIPEHLHEHMSQEWQCRVAPACPSTTDALRACMAPEPFITDQSCGQKVYDTVGPDIFKFLLRPEWNEFPRPRLAMIGGWGSPGSEVNGDQHVTLVNSFQEILNSSDPVNLQMFHRANADAPKLPVLPELLQWPLPELLDGTDEDNSCVCDMATRISRRGAVTWWHLDDGGEFVLQVCLRMFKRKTDRCTIFNTHTVCS